MLRNAYYDIYRVDTEIYRLSVSADVMKTQVSVAVDGQAKRAPALLPGARAASPEATTRVGISVYALGRGHVVHLLKRKRHLRLTIRVFCESLS